MRQEPAVLAGLVSTAIAAILVLLRTFGVPLTIDQQDAINKLVAVVAPIVLAIVIRQAVFSPATVKEDFEPRTARGSKLVDVPVVDPVVATVTASGVERHDGM